MILILCATLALVAALVVARATGPSAWPRLAAVEVPLRRYGPLVAAVLSIAIVWFVWGEVVPTPKVHDENSYVLQAEIFAHGRWTAPSPPIPEFFEQPHVLVVPAVASKYPPGHALLLSAGALVGFPALVPLLLTGLTAALIFGLATRLTNPWIALLTWVAWITSPIVLRFQPSYFSELTTTPLVLAAWWCLLRWRASGGDGRRWLLLLALAIGWGAITRPLTMLAFAIPIGVVVLRDVARSRRWPDLGLAVLVGVAILGILPLWNARTTGDWRLSPIELYRRDYLPFDKLGFTPDTTAPRRSVSPVLKTTYDYFLSARREQSLGALPRTAMDRVVQLTIALFQRDRLPLLPLALLGLAGMTGPMLFGLLSAVLLFIAHLPYAHWAPWTIYYLETVPFVSLLIASGTARVLRRLSGDRGDGVERLGLALAAAVVLLAATPSFAYWRRDHRTRSGLDRAFAAELRKLPPHSIVFIHYSPRVAQHMAAVSNYPDLDVVPVWVVHDLGPRNAELRRLAPDRASFDFDEDQLVRRMRP